MSKFQIALLGVFGFFILAAVLVFSIYRSGSSGSATVVIWGSIPASDFNVLLNDAIFTSDKETIVSYVEKPLSILESDFTEELALGGGPDLIILPQDRLRKARGKLIEIPYASLSENDFKNTFAEAAEIFLTSTGISAMPVALDPMVLYYNRDLLSAAGLAKPLAYWDETYAAAALLTKRDPAGNITQSTVALGETRNISNAKDILSMLFLQAGTSITAIRRMELVSTLNENPGFPVAPAESALDFYTQFANPSKPFYSWNRTMPDAQTHFAAGEAAYYLGFASELSTLRSKSPTLNLAVASVPQSRVAGKALTFGRIYGVAVSRGTRNAQASFNTAFKLVSSGGTAALARIMALPPARRDLLAAKPTDAIGPVFYTAALQAHSWLDPDPVVTKAIFSEMIEGVTSGRLRTMEALSAADSRLEEIINK